MDFDSFTTLIKSFTGYDENIWSEIEDKEEQDDKDSFFAKRLITGLAAEQYFETIQPQIPEFSKYTLENTTKIGCGYDFRLLMESKEEFLAVEVKGLKDRSGNLALTPKEYNVAATLTNRYFLFVVKNFREIPFHEIYKNPLSGSLHFTRKERMLVSVSWLASV